MRTRLEEQLIEKLKAALPIIEAESEGVHFCESQMDRDAARTLFNDCQRLLEVCDILEKTDHTIS